MDRRQDLETIFSDALRDVSVVDYLRQAASALDVLRVSAILDGTEEAIRLCEASQCVHRALIALTPP